MKSNNPSAFKKFLQNRKKRIDGLLHKQLTAITRKAPKRLADAMRYVTLNGGKRLRPILIYAIGEIYKVDIKSLDAPACAIEMIHCFSLVHDDLPAMDNDSLRRGKPTCHLAFNEATAILVGDALAIAAFQVLGIDKNLTAEKKLLMSKVLAEASGPAGMAGGQYIDLHPSGNKPSRRELEKMYLLKTGALISAAVKLGAIAAGTSKQQLKLLEQFALNLGLAFQIQDDILNIESNADKLGKNVGTDSAQNKITYPALVGIKQAKKKVAQLWRSTQKILQQLKITDGILQEFTSYVMQRDF
jgi:geranylgeranyl pyrophosphate synthase